MRAITEAVAGSYLLQVGKKGPNKWRPETLGVLHRGDATFKGKSIEGGKKTGIKERPINKCMNQ